MQHIRTVLVWAGLGCSVGTMSAEPRWPALHIWYATALQSTEAGFEGLPHAFPSDGKQAVSAMIGEALQLQDSHTAARLMNSLTNKGDRVASPEEEDNILWEGSWLALRQDWAGLERFGREVQAQSASTDSDLRALQGELWQACAEVGQARWDAAVDRLNAVREQLRNTGRLKEPPGLGILLAHAAWQAGQRDLAFHALDRSVAQLSESGQLGWLREAYLLRAHIHVSAQSYELAVLNASAVLERCDANCDLACLMAVRLLDTLVGEGRVSPNAEMQAWLTEIPALYWREQSVAQQQLYHAEFSWRDKLAQQHRASHQAALQAAQEELLGLQQTLQQRHQELWLWKSALIVLFVGMCAILLWMRSWHRQKRQLIVDKLEAAQGRLQELSVRAQTAQQAKSAFLANMSHEIRTPLNAIVGMATVLGDTPLSPEQRNYLESLYQNSESLLVVLNDMLDYARMEANELPIDARRFDLTELVQSVEQSFAASFAHKGLAWAVHLPANVPHELIGDPLRLRQVLQHLLGNALKFTQEGRVDLSLAVQKQTLSEVELQFTIADTGVGIAPELHESLFEAFTVADSSHTRAFSGSGLGLALSKRLVESMQGRIWMESEPGKGTTLHFTVQLKLEQAASRQEHFNNLCQGKRALIVDDQEVNLRILSIYLDKVGIQWESAASGAKALKKLEESPTFDIVITDYQMPGMYGVELLQRVQSRKAWKSLPVVIFSSVDQPEVRRQAEHYGVAAWLVKPVDRGVLYDTLGRVLRQRPQNAQREQAGLPMLPARHQHADSVRILLVEDDTVNQQVALMLLRRLGYRADVANNGWEAVNCIKQHSYDIVFMDLQMPRMDGLQATKEILRFYEEQDSAWVGELVRPRIVAMTASTSPNEHRACREVGMEDVLTKPIHIQALSQVLDRLPRKPATAT